MDSIDIESGQSLRVPFFTFNITIVNEAGVPLSVQVTHSVLVEPYVTITQPKKFIKSE